MLSQSSKIRKIEDFTISLKVTLSNCSVDVIRAKWDANPLAQIWYSGRQVNFGDEVLPDWRSISIEELINTFKSALVSQSHLVIKAMWNGNPILRNWFSSKPVNFGTTAQPDLSTIPLRELSSCFKSALSAGCKDVIESMWGGSTLLQNSFHNKLVPVDAVSLPNLRATFLNILTDKLKSALSNQSKDIIKAMWDKNPVLQSWFNGQQVDFGSSEQPDFRSISPTAVIINFTCALDSCCIDVINFMWEGNDILQNTLKNLDCNHSILILNKVLMNDLQDNNDFIIKYVNWINDINLIQSALQNLKQLYENKLISTHVHKQISLLEDRIRVLELKQLDTDLIMPIAPLISHPHHTDNFKRKLKVSSVTSTQASSKRKKTSSEFAKNYPVIPINETTIDLPKKNKKSKSSSSTSEVNALLVNINIQHHYDVNSNYLQTVTQPYSSRVNLFDENEICDIRDGAPTIKFSFYDEGESLSHDTETMSMSPLPFFEYQQAEQINISAIGNECDSVRVGIKIFS